MYSPHLYYANCILVTVKDELADCWIKKTQCLGNLAWVTWVLLLVFNNKLYKPIIRNIFNFICFKIAFYYEDTSEDILVFFIYSKCLIGQKMTNSLLIFFSWEKRQEYFYNVQWMIHTNGFLKQTEPQMAIRYIFLT